MRKSHLVASASLLFGMMMLCTVQAQSIDDIISKGTIEIGVNVAAPPYSTVNASGKVEGYDVDVGKAIADYLGVKAEFTPYPLPGRVPALVSGKVDIVIAALNPTPPRARVVMFTIPYASFSTNVIAGRDTNIADYDDLAGKTVATPRGTPQEAAIRANAPDSTKLALFDNEAIALQAVLRGQADAVAMAGTMFGEFKKDRPETKLEKKFVIYRQYVSIAVPQDSFELLQYLNTTISWMKVTGQLDKISEKWRDEPLPNDMPVF